MAYDLKLHAHAQLMQSQRKYIPLFRVHLVVPVHMMLIQVLLALLTGLYHLTAH
jgi:hypothetical protein